MEKYEIWIIRVNWRGGRRVGKRRHFYTMRRRSSLEREEELANNCNYCDNQMERMGQVGGLIINYISSSLVSSQDRDDISLFSLIIIHVIWSELNALNILTATHK